MKGGISSSGLVLHLIVLLSLTVLLRGVKVAITVNVTVVGPFPLKTTSVALRLAIIVAIAVYNTPSNTASLVDKVPLLLLIRFSIVVWPVCL